MRRKSVELSARMQALTRLVTSGMVVCDVGCDHGFVSIYLVQKGISDSVIAMDVGSGPLSHAREHIEEYGLESKIETRLSDGLQKLEIGEAECMISNGNECTEKPRVFPQKERWNPGWWSAANIYEDGMGSTCSDNNDFQPHNFFISECASGETI